MYCIKCGTKLEDGYVFCPNCGATNTPVTVQPVSNTAPYGNTPQPAPNTGAQPQPPYYTEPQPTPYDYAQTDPAASVGKEQTVLLDEPAAFETAPRFAPDQDANTGEEHTVLLDQPDALENTAESTSTEPVTAPEPLPYQDHYDEQATVAADDDQATVYAGDDRPTYNYANRGYTPDHQYASAQAPVYVPPVQNVYAPQDRKRIASEKPKKVYRRTSVGVKILSVILCILMFSFASTAVTLGSLRFALTEDHVREVCRDGNLTDIAIQYNGKEQKFADFIADGLLDSTTQKRTIADRTIINHYLSKSYVTDFVSNIAVDYSNYFMRGKTPLYLNADAVVNFMQRLNDDFKNDRVGFYMSDAYLEDVRKKVDDGDLTFLSIDANGNNFKQHYKFDPHWITLGLSVGSLLIWGVIALLFLLLIVLINRKNLPSGFKICGIALVVTGGLYLLTALGGFILSSVNKIYIASGLLKYFSLGMGIISLALVVIGIVLIIIKKAMMKNAVVE